MRRLDISHLGISDLASPRPYLCSKPTPPPCFLFPPLVATPFGVKIEKRPLPSPSWPETAAPLPGRTLAPPLESSMDSSNSCTVSLPLAPRRPLPVELICSVKSLRRNDVSFQMLMRGTSRRFASDDEVDPADSDDWARCLCSLHALRCGEMRSSRSKTRCVARSRF